jgi:hypothetical protein
LRISKIISYYLFFYRLFLNKKLTWQPQNFQSPAAMMGWKLECCTRSDLGLGKAEEVDMTTEVVNMTTEAPLEPTEEVASPKPAPKKS